MNYTVTIKNVDETPVVSTRINTPLSQIAKNMGDAFLRVCEYMAGQGLSTDGVGIALYHCQEFDPEHMDVEVGMALDQSCRSSGDFTFRHLPACTVASLIHTGPYEGLQAAYGALYEWVEQNGYEKNGPDREIYFNCPQTVASPEELRTEIALPVRKKH